MSTRTMHLLKNDHSKVSVETNADLIEGGLYNLNGDTTIDPSYFILSANAVKTDDFYIRFDQTVNTTTEWIEFECNTTTRDIKMNSSLDFDYLDSTYSIQWSHNSPTATNLLTVFISYNKATSKFLTQSLSK